MFLLFSHNLTKLQENDAIETFKIEEFVNLPQNLQNTWSEIPSNLENLNDYLMETFKGCLSSSDVNNAVEEGVWSVYPTCQLVKVALADGATRRDVRGRRSRAELAAHLHRVPQVLEAAGFRQGAGQAAGADWVSRRMGSPWFTSSHWALTDSPGVTIIVT